MTAPGGATLEKDERALWDDAREIERRLDASGLAYDDSALRAYVQGVADRLWAADAADAPAAPRVTVLRNPFLNAFALPHGAIYLHTGMLARMESEAQLAAVLAHELTHVTHRHALRQTRAARNKLAFARVLTVLAAAVGTAAWGEQMGRALGEMSASASALWTLAA